MSGTVVAKAADRGENTPRELEISLASRSGPLGREGSRSLRAYTREVVGAPPSILPDEFLRSAIARRRLSRARARAYRVATKILSLDRANYPAYIQTFSRCTASARCARARAQRNATQPAISQEFIVSRGSPARAAKERAREAPVIPHCSFLRPLARRGDRATADIFLPLKPHGDLPFLCSLFLFLFLFISRPSLRRAPFTTARSSQPGTIFISARKSRGRGGGEIFSYGRKSHQARIFAARDRRGECNDVHPRLSDTQVRLCTCLQHEDSVTLRFLFFFPRNFGQSSLPI